MLSRAMLPLTRPNILAPAVRASTLSVPHARWYAKNNKPKKTPYKVPESVKSKSTKPEKPEQPANAPREQYSTEQAEFDTKADPRENSTVNTSVPPASDPTSTDKSAPRNPLPDLTQGIPSTLAAEVESRAKGGQTSLNLTEDPAQAGDEYDDGRGGDIPKDGYVSSLDRRRARMAKLMYAVFALGIVAGTA
ncbi:mitochondrial inner membrane protein required for protein import, partial [Elasticomyces elasticus]